MKMKKIANWIKRHKWSAILTALLLLAASGWMLSGTGGGDADSQYATIPITRGDLHQVVTASGEIKPLNTIKVGSQVSGNIEVLYADYNSVVKKGDVLLTIDPSVLQASVDEAKAALDSAEAQLKFDRAEYNRNKTLFADGYIARAELEQSETKFKTSEQSVKRMQSQYDRAKTNLGYATIISPVDGTVISRKVDKGQTVAASFQAPDLFEIAEDLSKMKIETSVSEADIGMIKDGQNVSFSVDAYPSRSFEGKVNQIRLSPTTTSNVVVYTVVIDVDNSDLQLMPGMTAFVTIDVESREDAWKAANAAFLVRDLKSLTDDPRVKSGELTAKNALLIQRGGQKEPVLVQYKKGLVTATETEILPETDDAIRKGDKIITGKTGQKSSATGGQFGQRGGPAGMGGGRR